MAGFAGFAGQTKWDAASRIQFSGDYRFRLDYSDADTNGYWGAMDIANAAVSMIGAYGTNNIQDVISLMETFDPATRKATIEGMTNPVTGSNYAMQDKNTWENDILYTNRFRLGMKADISDNLEFKGRLAMYKAWGMQENPTAVGPYYMNSFSQMDGATTRQPSDSALRVDRAYINWINVADLPMWISVGRRPTTDGPPRAAAHGAGQQHPHGYSGQLHGLCV